MELGEKTLASELIFDGRLLKLYRDEVELAGGGKSAREYVHHPGGAAVVALDGDGNVWLERQFRYPYRKVVTEIPAGKLEEGEDPFDAVRQLHLVPVELQQPPVKDQLACQRFFFQFHGPYLPAKFWKFCTLCDIITRSAENRKSKS